MKREPPVPTQPVTPALTSEDFARARERWRKHATPRAWGYIDAPRADATIRATETS